MYAMHSYDVSNATPYIAYAVLAGVVVLVAYIFISSAGRKGRIESAPHSHVSPHRATERRADDGPTVALTDPQLPENEPLQTLYKIISTVPFTFLVYGPGDLAQCFREVSTGAPVFHTTEALTKWAGQFPGQKGIHWLGLNGPNGAAIAVPSIGGHDLEFGTKLMNDIVDNLNEHWQWSYVAKSEVVPAKATVPARFNNIFRVANVVR